MSERWWMRDVGVYADRRMAGLCALGFSSGLPLLLVFSTLSFWLLDEGLSLKAVGLFAATSTPYSLKFLWAPLLDHVRLPWLTRRLGRRRSWMLIFQLGLIGALLALATSTPAQTPVLTAALAVLVATLSASQDVVIDAFRVESLSDEEQGAGAAAAVFGYRLGMIVAGAGALFLAHALGSWPLVYACMAACMSVGVATTLLSREPELPPQTEADTPPPETRGAALVRWQITRALWSPLREIMTRRGWVAMLLFVMLYKMGDALAGVMLNPMLVELSFTKLEIAGVAKTYGVAASIVGVFLGGWLVRHTGVLRALWIAGFMQMFSNLVFVLQAVVGHDLLVLTLTVGVENLCGGFGTAAFVAYLSSMCKKEYTATQYALLTALSSLLRSVVSTSSGVLAAALGWPLFFLATTATALPGLLLLHYLTRVTATAEEAAHAEPT